MAKRISVILSQGQSNNPAKRQLEEDIVTARIMEPGIDVTVIPNLYDLRADGTGMLALQGVSGDMIVLSWLFPRAAHWILDRNNILGRQGQVLLVPDDDADDEDEDAEEDAIEASDEKQRVVDQREIPNRKIYCLDLRTENKCEPYVEEVMRIAREAATQVVSLMDWVGGTPRPDQMQRYLEPANDTALGNGGASAPVVTQDDQVAGEPKRIDDQAGRRWYPVIDFSRCTNCMECIDFCLFGVYGVDVAETILVEQPDNCRKGCPACSRVCPENAIIFPQHKTPAIAGSADISAGLKIDLSQLFGAPAEGRSAEEIAVLERDEQLLIAGRDAVGATVGIAKRQEGRPDQPKDELDDLIDELDSLDI